MNALPRSSSLRVRILVLVSAVLLATNAVTGAIFWWRLHTDHHVAIDRFREESLERVRSELSQQVQIANGILARAEALPLPLEERQSLAKSMLDTIRFGTSGYFFAYDSDGVCRVLPTKQEWVGQRKWDNQDKKGKYFIRALVEAGRRGGDTVHYVFDKPGHPDLYPKLAYARWFQPWGWMIGTGVYIDDIDARVAAKEGELESALHWSLLSGLGATSLAGVGLLGLVWFLVGASLTPLRRLNAGLDDISHGTGDLTARLEEGRSDEIGSAATAFNRFVATIHALVRDLAGTATRVSASARGLRESSRSAQREAQAIESASRTMASAGAVASGSIREIAQGAEVVSSNVSSVAAALEEMSASLAEVSRSCQEELLVARRATSMTRTASDRMTTLSSAAKDIGSILESIRDIADQTKLLALNATIEAARAGEMGKGFAIVASEVKELAKQTGDATEDIRSKIEAIQAQTHDAAEAIRLVSAEVGQVDALSQSIGSAVEEQTATVADISRNVSHVRSEATTISRAVAGSVDTLEAVSRGAEEIHGNLENLAAGIRSLNEAADGFEKTAADMSEGLGRFKT